MPPALVVVRVITTWPPIRTSWSASAVGMTPPRPGDAGAGARAARVPQQELEQGELPRAQVHDAVVLRDAPRQRVERQGPDLEGRVLVTQLGPADERVHPRDQLGEVERLREIIVRAALEAAHPRLELVLRGE